MARFCITEYSKDCSLASNLQAPQQGIAFQWSDSSEKSSPRLPLLNRNEPYNIAWMLLLLPFCHFNNSKLRKASIPTLFCCNVCYNEIQYVKVRYNILK